MSPKITADLIKELREKTNVGMLDCKKALEETEGNIEKAIELLRKKGVAVAAKRAGNAANHGIVTMCINDDYTAGALVEISCETDFAAQTDTMRLFATNLVQKACKEQVTGAEELLNLGTAPTLQDMLNEVVAKISENIKVGRLARFATSHTGVINGYIHSNSTLGVLVHIESDGTLAQPAREKVAQLCKDVAMQAAVTAPLAISPEQIDSEVVEKERNIYKEQLLSSGKSAEIAEKIVVGKLEKFYEENCLLRQKYIKNDKMTLQQHVQEVAKSIGVNLSVVGCSRFSVGNKK